MHMAMDQGNQSVKDETRPFFVNIEGVEYPWHKDTITREEIIQLGGWDPSLGVIASLAVTEFMVTVTGIRAPQRLLTYYGNSGKVTVSTDTPMPDCWYCKGVWGRRKEADVERYLRADIRQWLR
jgi:hypothetical protein